MNRDFFRLIDQAVVCKHNCTETRDRGIRLYCTAAAATHGFAYKAPAAPKPSMLPQKLLEWTTAANAAPTT